MRRWTTLSGSLFTAACSFAVASHFLSETAWADAVLTSPTPRRPTCDDATCKIAPCASTSPGAPTFNVEADASLAIVWTETIDRQGCYVLEISSDGQDHNFQVLETIPDDQDNVPATHAAAIAFDGGLSCDHCVLRLRQISTGSSVGCTADTDADTYFSCADITVGSDASVSNPGPPANDASNGPSSPIDPGRPDAGTGPGGSNANNGAGPYEVDPITPARSKGCAAAPVGFSYEGMFGMLTALALSIIGIARRRRP